MEENQPTSTGPGLPSLASIIYFCLLVWAVMEVSARGNGGCDGGTCAVGLLLVPVFLVGYALLLPAAFWIQRPGYAWSGIAAALLTLLSMGIALSVLADGNLGKISAALLLFCGASTLVGIVAGFVRKVKARN